jgi:hypothetical protein
MERYVLEVANRQPSRREEEMLAAARAEMIKCFAEGIIEEVGMGKYKRMLIEEGRQEGREEGREEGRQEGRQEGEAFGMRKGEVIGIRKGEVIGIEVGQRQFIRRLLERRFGPLPEWAVARVARSTPDERDLWMDRALTASDLRGVLGEG